MDEPWVVVGGALDIPVELLASAAAGQASLSDKLAALRSLNEPFPHTVGPAACDPPDSPSRFPRRRSPRPRKRSRPAAATPI